MRKKILIEGMSCEHCVKAVTEALGKLDGVGDVKVSLEEKNATVDIDGDVSDEAIKIAIKGAGYEVVGIEKI
ncbi:copper chaperone CopZ [Andreesenia angusta]|uniref:Copper chaperone CopZ n=1 Tax=Andreesenia angusta TaxID=39480 RepID=A0A1S1V9E1_9FIRM|nr:copper ion binding protein [Andreesenia angusta]OHW63134.1 copper chaperone CopZ [Andreesenia angusta]